MRIPVDEHPAMASEPPCLGKLLPQEVGRLVWRINCSREAPVESLISFRNTVQNGSLRKVATARARRFRKPGFIHYSDGSEGRSPLGCSRISGRVGAPNVRYFSSLGVTTGMFLSRATRFKADMRFHRHRGMLECEAGKYPRPGRS
jgi:hypothetical protein